MLNDFAALILAPHPGGAMNREIAIIIARPLRIRALDAAADA
jgi:hypothetical protein